MHWLQLQFIGPLAVAIALMWAGLWCWSLRSAGRSRRRDPLVTSPWQKLCQVHGVSNVDVIRLNGLCRATGVADPLLLFVDPRLLEQAAKGDHEPGEYARLGQQLFAELFRADAQG